MASYSQAENRTWSVRFRAVENGEVKHKRLSGFATKKDAIASYNNYISTHTFESPIKDKSKVNFETLFDNYCEYYINEIKGSSYITFKALASHYIVPYFKDKAIHLISIDDVLKWKSSLNQVTMKNGNKLSVKYRNSIFGELVHILNYAMKFFELKQNVALQVGNFKDKNSIKKEMEFWTPQEFKQFISVANDIKYKTLFLFLYLTGCRKGELCALQWKDIDLNKGVVKIYKTATRKTLDGSAYNITPPKSKNGIRKVLLPKALCEQMKVYKKSLGTIKTEHYIFGDERVLPYTNIDRTFNAWIVKSNVKKIRLHDLRHSHVSFLINTSKKASLSLVYIIANRIGDRPEEVMETYAHLFPNEQEELISELDTNVGTFLGTI